MEPNHRTGGVTVYGFDVEWEIVGLSRFYSRKCIPDSLWICQPSVGVPFFEAVQLLADSQSPTHTPSKQNTEKQHRHHRDWTDNRHIRWKNHYMKTQPLVTFVYFPSFPSQICSGDRSDIKVAQFAMSSAIQGGSNFHKSCRVCLDLSLPPRLDMLLNTVPITMAAWTAILQTMTWTVIRFWAFFSGSQHLIFSDLICVNVVQRLIWSSFPVSFSEGEASLCSPE